MEIQGADPEQLGPIQNLLSTVGLPHDDLTASHLEHFLVCHDGNEVHGVVGLEPYGDVALLRSLAVPPAHQNDGIGARLTAEIERHARRKGVTELYLLTTTASQYFRRRGYDRIDREDLPPAIRETEEAARLCPSTATCMRKTLSTADDGPQATA